MPVRLRRRLTVRDHAEPPTGLEWRTQDLEVRDSLPGGRSQWALVWACVSDERLYLRTHEDVRPTHVKAEFEWLFGFRSGGYAAGKCISVPLSEVELSF